jgi:hypothetical protein
MQCDAQVSLLLRVETDVGVDDACNIAAQNWARIRGLCQDVKERLQLLSPKLEGKNKRVNTPKGLRL